MRYSHNLIGNKSIKSITARSKNRYALYVDQGDTHELVLSGSSWDSCRSKTIELVSRGVSWTDIYGEIQSVSGSEHWGNARKHLWWTTEDAY